MGADDEGVPILAQQSAGQGTQFCIATPVRGGGCIGIGSCGSHFFNHIELIDPTLRGLLGGSFFSAVIQEGFLVGSVMVGVALFGHEDAIHAQGHISKDGVTNIVHAVGVFGIVAIGVSQIGFQYLIPSRRIRQAHFDLKSEFVEIVIIVRGRDGKRDGLYARQGGLKHHVPGRFVPVIHLGHIKQIERHDADCPRRLTACPFYRVSASDHPHQPEVGVHPGRRQEKQGITHSHACGLAKNRAPFHPSAAALFQVF